MSAVLPFNVLGARDAADEHDADLPDPLADMRASIRSDLSAGSDAIDRAQAPEFITHPHFPICGANLAAGGGTGKTTTVVNECIQIVAGGELYGRPVDKQGPCVIVTAEDGAGYVRYIQQRVLTDGEQLGAFSANVVKCAKARMPVISWPRVKFGPLVYVDQLGGFHRADGFDALLEEIAQLNPSVVTLDPAVLFSAGERYGNDGDAFFASMIHEAALELRCCFQVIDHVSQNVARTGIVDQYAARGGSAKSDNARMARQLVVYRQDEKDPPQRMSLPFAVTAEDIAKGRVMQMHWTKLNYAPKPDPVWLLRRGYLIQGQRPPTAEMREEQQARLQAQQDQEDIEAVVSFIAAQLAIGVRLTKNQIEKDSVPGPGGKCIPRERRRTAVHTALVRGLLVNEALPVSERHGGRQTFLAVRGGS